MIAIGRPGKILQIGAHCSPLYNASLRRLAVKDPRARAVYTQMLKSFQAALDPADPRPYATQYRVDREAGDVRWVEAHGLAHFEGNGRERRAVSIVGTVWDITEQKEREEKEHLLM